ncbi:MAG TPA: malto-oligosyltrehalose trehalohydrolase [Thermoanaerobaculia bacterium]|nr:malto-oligosyltrehalose trehalohydrolase [Thermoanaerobaculia bacterium]
MSFTRRRAIGAEIADGGVHFRVWAPSRRKVAVVIGDRDHPLDAEQGGYFSGLVQGAGAGTLYRFRLDDEREAYPDPASRFQPDGPHGPSQVIDSSHRPATGWKGVDPDDLVIQELHIGTFTGEGTWKAAMEKLPLVAEVGINLLELMPVAEFPGRFGWGYDGVDMWAPTRLYGTPDDFRAFVDAAHGLGMGVILDVVYNHFGPDGCYVTKFSPSYFTDRYENEWGVALNFDGEESAGVREFFIENAAYWIDELRLDGLRVDATQSIYDASPRHIISEVAQSARRAGGGRTVFLVAENEPQDVRMVEELGLDAMWNDDWHHSAAVALTGRGEAYYSDYRGTAQEFVSMARLGFLYQGQRYKWQQKRRGTPSGALPRRKLVCYLENHDQLANSLRGARMHQQTSPGRMRAMTALLLLAPQTPMLFQGQEWGSPKPFLYFADHEPELAEKVLEGRFDFLKQFPRIATPEIQRLLPSPDDPETFRGCKLDWNRDGATLRLHRDLIALRRSLPRPAALDGAVLAAGAFVLRWADHLLVINLGPDLRLDPAPEPLLAPPPGREWELLWSSEAPEYGGGGTPALDTPEENWRIPAQCVVVLR